MKSIKAACLLVLTLAVLAVPATQAIYQGTLSRTVVRDLFGRPIPAAARSLDFGGLNRTGSTLRPVRLC